MALPVTALQARVLELVWFGWLDFLGDPVRATTLPGGRTFAAGETGDPDLDGRTFEWVPGGLVSVGELTQDRDGASGFEVTLSGLVGPDNDLLNMLATSTNWRGRTGRLWHGTATNGVLSAIAGYGTGYMVSSVLGGLPDGGQTVTIGLENYIVLLTQARGRTYQDQALYDPGDLSAARIRAAANGQSGAAILPGTSTRPSGGGTGFADRQNVDFQ